MLAAFGIKQSRRENSFMKITKNRYQRFEISSREEGFTKGGRRLSGIAGYGKCFGWILALFGWAICLKDEKNRTVYLNRKSAIHWINRNEKQKIEEKSSAKKVVDRIKGIFRRPIIDPPVVIPEPSEGEQRIIELERLGAKKSYQNDGSIWFEKVQELTAYRGWIKQLSEEGFFALDKVRNLPDDLRRRLFDHLASDTFRYGYEGIKFQEPFYTALMELFFNLDPTDEQLARYSTYLPVKDLKLEWIQKIKESLGKVDFETLKPYFKIGANRMVKEVPATAQVHIFNILTEYLLCFTMQNSEYSQVTELVNKLQTIDPGFNFDYLQEKNILPLYGLIFEAFNLCKQPEDEKLLQEYKDWEPRYRDMLKGEFVGSRERSKNEKLFEDHYDNRTPLIPGLYALKNKFESLDKESDPIILQAITQLEKVNKSLKFVTRC